MQRRDFVQRCGASLVGLLGLARAVATTQPRLTIPGFYELSSTQHPVLDRPMGPPIRLGGQTVQDIQNLVLKMAGQLAADWWPQVMVGFFHVAKQPYWVPQCGRWEAHISLCTIDCRQLDAQVLAKLSPCPNNAHTLPWED